MANFNISYIFNAIDKLSPVTEKISKSFKKVQNSATKVSQSTSKFNERLKKIANQSDLANNSLIKLATGYLSLSSAIGFGKSLIVTQVQLQNINAGLKAVTGSQAAATAEFEFAKKAADEIGVSFSDLILPYTKFLAASKMGREENQKVFLAFNKLSRVFGLTGDQTAGIFRALEQMQSKGKVMSEELRLQLGDRLPGALDLFAEAAGVSTAQFVKFMEEGRIGAGIMKNVAEVIERKYGKAAIDASQTLGASLARLKNAFFELKSETSEGAFTTIVIKSVQFLTDNMDKLFKAVMLVVGAFSLWIALKLPIFVASLTAQTILSIGAVLNLFKVLAIFALTNPFGIILTTLGLLILNSKKFRDDFVTVMLFLKDIAKDIFGWIVDKLEWIIDRFKIVGDFFSGIRDKVRGGISERTLGQDNIGVGLARTEQLSKTISTLGLEGVINIRGAPTGSTAQMTTFGTNKSNLGVNMSFASGGV